MVMCFTKTLSVNFDTGSVDLVIDNRELSQLPSCKRSHLLVCNNNHDLADIVTI